jgi:hypothetical protein
VNLETAVGPRQKVQDFESELLTVGVEHSQKVKATPSVSDYGSKDCAFCPDPTAVSRFMQKWPRLWKASLLSLLGLIDMGVWVGEAIERTVAGLGASSVTQKAALLRCWNRVEQAIDIQSFSALKTLLRRVRRERERDFLNNLRSLKGQPAAKEPIDVGYAERAIGLEEFLLKIMIEMAANALQDGGRVSTGLKEFGSVHQLIEEHIKVVGAEAAEASAMNLVLQTVKAEENYLRLCHTWGKSTQKQILDQARQAKEYHEAHCAVIDGYMELSDSKSLRGVMLCYELPIFTQLLYDQRKRLDKALKEQTREDRVC